MSVCSYVDSARDFMLKEKKVHEEALAIINQYTNGDE